MRYDLTFKDEWDAYYADMTESVPEETPYQQGFHEAMNCANDFIQARAVPDENTVKQGRWIYEAHKENTNYRWHVTAECSECSEYADGKEEIWAGFFPNVPDLLARAVALQDAEQVAIGRYCSNCGAKMVEEDAWTD